MGASLLSVTSSTCATGGAFTGAQGAGLAITTGGADRLRVCWRMAGVEKSSAAPRGIVGQPRVRLELLLASVLQAASPPKARELLLMRSALLSG